jgi:hypothetical protein
MKCVCFAFLFTILASAVILSETNSVPLINQSVVPTSAKEGVPTFKLTAHGTVVALRPDSSANWEDRLKTFPMGSSALVTM